MMSSKVSGCGEPDYQNGIRGKDAESANDCPKKYTLSADAPVFVPKFNTQTVHQQEYDRCNTITQSGGGATVSSLESPVDMFKMAVITLTKKGNVEEYMKPIVAKLKNGITDMTVLYEMIDILFDHSIRENNFSYTGAHICKYLSNELRSHHMFSNFMGLFLNKCRSAYDNREVWVSDPAMFNVLSNLAMLIGQLFLVLEEEVNGELQKVGILRQAISDLLLTLLAVPTDERIKTAATLLKLTGYEITKNCHLAGEFDEIYNIIRSLEKHPNLNRTSHCLINSVLSRLEYNWGVELTL